MTELETEFEDTIPFSKPHDTFVCDYCGIERAISDYVMLVPKSRKKKNDTLICIHCINDIVKLRCK